MESDVASRKLFIGGLSYGTDDDKLKSYFEQYGSVQDAVVMKDPVTRRSRGFGFITYTQQSFVDQALSAGVHVIDSRKVEAKRAVPRHEVVRDQISPTTTTTSSSTTTTTNTTTKSLNNNSHNHNHNNNNHHHQQQNLNGNNYQIGNSQQQQQQYHNELHVNSDEYAYCKIFVGGLHYDTRDGEFRNYFEKYGRVISAEVMFNRETHKSRGFGFIIFDNEESVDRVCDEKDHSIDGKTVEVKRAVPRSKIGLMTSATATTNTTNSNSTIGTTNSNDNDNGNNNFNNLAAFPPVSPLNKNTTSTNNVQNITSSSNSNGQKTNSNTSGNLVNNNNNNNNNNNVSSNNVNNNNSNNNNSSSSQVKKITPGTPPTSYAAVVISGPNANASNSSQQNSPQIQPITQSPSFGPIGSPTNASNSNSSFGMMLPPLHSSNNNNNGSGSNNNLNSMSGTNSLNNSTHGNNSYIQSPYRSHSSSISDLSEPYQNHQNHYHHQQQHQQIQIQMQQQHQHQNKSGVLLQHQEQFPPPSSPLRSMTSNYPPLTNQSYFQYPQLSVPNPSHARNRALSESFLFMPPSKSFQLSLGIMTPSPDLPYPPLLPSNLDSTNEVFEENSPDKVNDFNIQLSSENTQTDDDILGNSSWSPSKLSSLSGNKEVQLENLFSSNRQDIERSVSLGGLGWMPSSLSTQNFPPPQSRRGFSDLGVGIGFGHDNSERDIGYGFGLPDLNDINHHQMQQQQHQQQQFQYQQQQMQQHQQMQIQQQQQQQLQQQQQQFNNSSFVPSMSAWESFLDQATNGQNISPSRPHSYSLNNLHDGLSPSRHYHSNMNINLNHSIHYNTQNNSQSTTTTSNSILNNGVDENDDNSYCIQELRLQAPEYTPNNIQPSSSSTSSSPWLSR